MGSDDRACRILTVDDAPATLEVLRRQLSPKGYQVFAAPGVCEAVKFLATNAVDLVITDLKMPGPDGMDLVRHVRQNLPDTEVMIITGYASLASAVEAVKSGAQEYLAKPFTETELLEAVEHALEKLARRRSSQAGSTVRLPGLIGQSPAMTQVFADIDKAAGSSATVLVTGESGTGKELVARAIHYRSGRASAPLVPVNCGGIPEGLLESELFGHMKGAFTGAVESRAGFLHAADGGSLFLDEVAEMSLSMQVKFLRVLQDQEVRMIGSDRPRKVDVRILAATNKDLAHLVAKGAFRQDLYYRLNVISIAVPPLRDRGDDVLHLANHFARKFGSEREGPAIEFSDEVLQAFRTYTWPGNVRELENLVHRLAVMCDEARVTASDLPPAMRFSVSPSSAGVQSSLAQVEAEHIRNVLVSVGWNKSRAAAILEIDRKTIQKKMTDHKITPPADHT